MILLELLQYKYVLFPEKNIYITWLLSDCVVINKIFYVDFIRENSDRNSLYLTVLHKPIF